MSSVDGIEMLKGLTQIEKDNLSLFCQEKILKAGEVLFDENEEASAMYFLLEGKIEISKLKDGKYIKLGDIDAEDILGEMALFSENKKRMARAKAVEKCVLLTILSFSIKELTLKHSDLLEKIKDIINYRMIQNKNIK